MAMEATSVLYPMFDRNNYDIWAVKMSIALKAQGLWDADEGYLDKCPR
jgi:hypothetical protein